MTNDRSGPTVPRLSWIGRFLLRPEIRWQADTCPLAHRPVHNQQTCNGARMLARADQRASTRASAVWLLVVALAP